MIKISENICVVPHCEETKMFIERGCPFCIEHSIKFKDFAPRYEVPSEIKKILRTDEDLPDEFIIHMISTFCDEEEREHQQIRKN